MSARPFIVWPILLSMHVLNLLKDHLFFTLCLHWISYNSIAGLNITFTIQIQIIIRCIKMKTENYFCPLNAIFIRPRLRREHWEAHTLSNWSLILSNFLLLTQEMSKWYCSIVRRHFFDNAWVQNKKDKIAFAPPGRLALWFHPGKESHSAYKCQINIGVFRR